MKNEEAIRNAKTFDELLDIKYGKIGSSTRDEYEAKANYFVISEMLKEARKEANITQEQLADKIGTKKSYISQASIWCLPENRAQPKPRWLA